VIIETTGSALHYIKFVDDKIRKLAARYAVASEEGSGLEKEAAKLKIKLMAIADQRDIAANELLKRKVTIQN
jgi:hypothetical protein